MSSERKKFSKLIFDIFWLFLLNGFSLYLIFTAEKEGYSDWIYSFFVFSFPIIINWSLLIYIHDIFETETEFIEKAQELYKLNIATASKKARLFTRTVRIGKIGILISIGLMVLIMFLGFKLKPDNISTGKKWLFISSYFILLLFSCIDKLFNYLYPKSFKQQDREDEAK